MRLKTDIQLDSLKLCINREKKKEDDEVNNYSYSKIVDFNFFIKNELEISEKINNTLFGAFYCNTLCNFKNITTNHLPTKILPNKEYLILNYKNNGKDIIYFFSRFKNSNFYCEFIFNIYNQFLDILANSEKPFMFIDLNYENMYLTYDNFSPYLSNFDKCFWLQDNEKKNISILKKTIEEITYFGNKHIILFILHKIGKNKVCSIIDIISEYVNQLYFLRKFSQDIKKQYQINCEKYINNIINITESENSFIIWEDLLLSYLFSANVFREIEKFKLNSLFLNIAISLIPKHEIIIHNLLTNLQYPIQTIYIPFSSNDFEDIQEFNTDFINEKLSNF
jgi:hypothetical protein